MPHLPIHWDLGLKDRPNLVALYDKQETLRTLSYPDPTGNSGDGFRYHLLHVLYLTFEDPNSFVPTQSEQLQI